MVSSLKEKAVKGISWNLIEKFGIQGIKFILGIILARLLTPEDFGLIGMITVFFAVANVFINSGFGAAYVQKKEVSDVDANTVFFTNLGISIILYGILWIAAPVIADFYEQPKLIDLTQVMGLVILINAFNVIQIAQVKRNINFKRKTKITLFGTITSGIIAVSAAYYGLGVWSLVIYQLGHRFLTTTGLWISNKWSPSLKFSITAFKSMFSFGGWMLLSGIIRKIFDNIYILTIGKFFPAAQVGFYTKSKDFQRMGANRLAQAVGEIAFPVLSNLQDNKEKMQNAMRKFLKYSMAFIMPLLVTLIVIADPFVILLLKEKWAPMVPYLQLLSIVGILYPIHYINTQVLLAQGKSKWSFNLDVIKNGMRILNIIIMYRFGVLFIIIGEVILSIIALTINTYYTNKLINYGFLYQIRDIYKIGLGALIAGGTAFIISSSFENLWIILITGLVLTIVIYSGIQYFINKKLIVEIISLKGFFKS